MIRDCSQEAQKQKMETKILLSSRTLDHFFKLAFDHYANKLDEPFDFLKALFTIQPLPNTFSANISRMLRQTFQAAQNDIDGDDRASVFAQVLAPVICSAVALDVVRSYEHLPGTLMDIFKGDASRATQNTWKLSSFSYENQVSSGFASFIEDSMRCEFSKGNVRCENRYKAHLALRRHQGGNGEIIGNGSFESEFLDEITKYWETELKASLDSLTQLLGQDSKSLVATSPTDAAERQVPPTEAVIWSIHQDHLDELYRTLPKLEISDVHTCFWCMRNKVIEILPCSHAVCEACLVAMGSIDCSVDFRVVQIDFCNLHNPRKEFKDPIKVLLLPSNIGRRLLSIDGGGVRGIISLSILSAIEQKLGGQIPISEFFDLVGGTSVGGLAALGMVLGDWKARNSVDILTKLSSEAFKPHSQWTLVQLFKRVRTGAGYESEALEKAIHNAFGERSRLQFLGMTGEKSYGQRTKVFVTATTDGGERGTIFANYTRHSANGLESGTEIGNPRSKCSYDFEATYLMGQQCKLWQAARATSAAPLYFSPVKVEGFEYWDGGLFFNNPAPAAIREAELIWPLTNLPDILLSVGNGTEATAQQSNPPEDSPGIIRPGRRVLHAMWGVLGHLTTLKTRLLKNMDSEGMWTDNFASLARQHPARYVRLSPLVAEKLPQLDDVQAIESGKLGEIATTYLRDQITQKQIDCVSFTLISTCFYLQPTRTLYESDTNHFVIEGKILCRFANRSKTLQLFGHLVRNLGTPRFVQAGSRNEWKLDEPVVSIMVKMGVFEIQINVRTLGYDSEVDIRFLFDGFEGGSISGCPVVLGNT